MNNFNYNPVNGLTDQSAFPDNPGSSAEARTQIQTPLNQARDFINNTIVDFFNNGGNVGGNISISNSKIVESGSNANGNWIKYYDGTMVQIGAYSTVAGTFPAQGNLYGETYQMTFPVPFINVPIIVGNVSSSGYTFGSTNVPTTTGVGVRVLSPLPYGSLSIKYQYIAIGKWK